jgi:hypothetical protein
VGLRGNIQIMERSLIGGQRRLLARPDQLDILEFADQNSQSFNDRRLPKGSLQAERWNEAVVSVSASSWRRSPTTWSRGPKNSAIDRGQSNDLARYNQPANPIGGACNKELLRAAQERPVLATFIRLRSPLVVSHQNM